jgi:hypothetical protein
MRRGIIGWGILNFRLTCGLIMVFTSYGAGAKGLGNKELGRGVSVAKKVVLENQDELAGDGARK